MWGDAGRCLRWRHFVWARLDDFKIPNGSGHTAACSSSRSRCWPGGPRVSQGHPPKRPSLCPIPECARSGGGELPCRRERGPHSVAQRVARRAQPVVSSGLHTTRGLAVTPGGTSSGADSEQPLLGGHQEVLGAGLQNRNRGRIGLDLGLDDCGDGCGGNRPSGGRPLSGHRGRLWRVCIGLRDLCRVVRSVGSPRVGP